jgi:hypothetical protein
VTDIIPLQPFVWPEYKWLPEKKIFFSVPWDLEYDLDWQLCLSGLNETADEKYFGPCVEPFDILKY